MNKSANIKATNHVIRYVLALSLFVANAQTTKTRDTANMAAVTDPAMEYEVELNSTDH